jgi:hypothetical protein
MDENHKWNTACYTIIIIFDLKFDILNIRVHIDSLKAASDASVQSRFHLVIFRIIASF